MTPELAVHANRLVDSFTLGRFQDIRDMYALPLAIYAGDRLFVFSTWDDLVEGMSAYRTVLVKAGLAMVETTVVGTPRHAQRQFTLRVRNRYFDRAGAEIDHSEITYFMERTDGETHARIRLVEYERWPLDEDLFRDQALAALSRTSGAPHGILGAH
jgi:hypothetical protein